MRPGTSHELPLSHDMYLKLWGAERKPFTRFRTDNGGEFKGEFDQILSRHHTHHEWALADRPTTNARIEGLNRRVIEGTGAALLQANAPYYLWLYAAYHWAKTMVYTETNQHGVTPFETLRGRPPPAGRAISFGCHCVYRPGRTSALETSRLKFPSRGRDGIIIG